MSAKMDALLEAVESGVDNAHYMAQFLRFTLAGDAEARAAMPELRAEIARLEREAAPVDGKGRTWHVMLREGGSVCLYYTRQGQAAHYVVWDSLDHEKAEA